jgi:hypothetical protein
MSFIRETQVIYKDHHHVPYEYEKPLLPEKKALEFLDRFLLAYDINYDNVKNTLDKNVVLFEHLSETPDHHMFRISCLTGSIHLSVDDYAPRHVAEDFHFSIAYDGELFFKSSNADYFVKLKRGRK